MNLKLKNRKRYPGMFFGGSLVVLGAWLLFAHGHRPELLLSSLGIIAGVPVFLYRQHLDETRLFKELFVEFNLRYEKLNQGLNDVLSLQSTGLLSSAERKILFDYFNLCAEEHLFYTAGYIDRQVWTSWRNGMSVFFRNPQIRSLWEEDCVGGSYYGFVPPDLT